MSDREDEVVFAAMDDPSGPLWVYTPAGQFNLNDPDDAEVFRRAFPGYVAALDPWPLAPMTPSASVTPQEWPTRRPKP